MRVAIAWQTVIVQSSLANRHDLGVPRQFAQCRTHIRRRFAGMARMPAYRGEYAREFFAQLRHAFAAGQVGADGDDLRDPCPVCTLNDLRQVRTEIRKIKMSMSVVKS